MSERGMSERAGEGGDQPAATEQGQRRLIVTLAAVAALSALAALWATVQLRSMAARSGPGGGVVNAVLDGTPGNQSVGDGPPFSGFVAQPPMEAADFTLTRTDGTEFTLSEQRGDVVLLFFGYTNCPDVCPQTLTWLAAALNQLGSEEERVRVVFVSVDPDRDSPEVIDAYTGAFDPRIVGVTGTLPELENVVASYSSNFFKTFPEHEHAPGVATDHAHDDYTMAHPSEVYVIDQAGMLREFFSTRFSPDEVEHDVRLLLEGA
jgi:protein SCO1/2